MSNIKYIDVTPEVRKKLMQLCNMTPGGVSFALSYKRNGEASNRVRQLALEMGGIIRCDLPEIETIHDIDGTMRQTFRNGIELVAYKGTGLVELIRKVDENEKEIVASYPNTTIAGLADIQVYAHNL